MVHLELYEPEHTHLVYNLPYSWFIYICWPELRFLKCGPRTSAGPRSFGQNSCIIYINVSFQMYFNWNRWSQTI